MKNVISCVLLSLLAVVSVAQPYGDSKFKQKFNKADALVFDGSYMEAIPLLEEMYAFDTTNANLNYLLGVSYLLGKKDHVLAIKRLESATKDVSLDYNEANWKERKAPGLAYLYLGKAYHYKNQFDRAINNYYNYRSFIEMDDVATYNKVRQQIQYAENAMELIKNPVGVKVKNLGPGVNSKYTDYCPVVSADGKTLIFTSRREGGTGGVKDEDGNYYDDIYICQRQADGSWSKPKSIGSNINTAGHDAAIGLSPNGQLLFIYKDDNNDGNIYFSQRKGAEWTAPQLLGSDINTPAWETHASVNATEDLLVFVSNRSEGGFGGRDLWYCKKLPNGEWGLAMNMGSVINSQYEEDSPFISADGKTLIFSSQGHTSMGGFDIFRSEFEDGAWTIPENIGYPINTSEDDVFFTLTPDGRTAYYSSYMDGGFGEADLYQLKLELKKSTAVAVARGIMKVPAMAYADISAKIIVSDEGGAQVGTYRPTPSTGHYVLILQPGETYSISYQADGYEPIEAKIAVADDESYAEYDGVLELEEVVFGDDILAFQAETKKLEEEKAAAIAKAEEDARLAAEAEQLALEKAKQAEEAKAKEVEKQKAQEAAALEKAEAEKTLALEKEKAAEAEAARKRAEKEAQARARVKEQAEKELAAQAAAAEKAKAEEEAKALAAKEQAEKELTAQKEVELAAQAAAAEKAKAEEEAKALAAKEQAEKELTAQKEAELAAQTAAAEKAKAEEEVKALTAKEQAEQELAAQKEVELAAQAAAAEKAKAEEEAKALAAKEEAEKELAAQKEAELAAQAAAAEKAKAEEEAKALAAKEQAEKELAAQKEAELAAQAAAAEKAKAEEEAKALAAKEQAEKELTAQKEVELAAQAAAAEKAKAEEEAEEDAEKDAQQAYAEQAEIRRLELESRIKALKAQQEQNTGEVEVKEVAVQDTESKQEVANVDADAIREKREAMLARIKQLKKDRNETERKASKDELVVKEASDKVEEVRIEKESFEEGSEKKVEEINALENELKSIEEEVVVAKEKVEVAQSEKEAAEEVLDSGLAEKAKLEEEERIRVAEAAEVEKQLKELEEQEKQRIEAERLAAIEFEKEQQEEAERTKRELIQLEAVAEQKRQVEVAMKAEERKKAAMEQAEEEAYTEQEILANAETLEQLKELNEKLIEDNLDLRKQLAELNSKLDLILARLDYTPVAEKVEIPTSNTRKTLEEGRRLILRNIFFDYNMATLRSKSKHELNKLFEFMKENPDIQIVVSGHTDSRGNDDYNMRLSKDRAQAVVDYLIRNGISSKRLSAKGYGETRPIARNENADLTDNPVGRQLNRRIEISVPQEGVKGVEMAPVEIPNEAKIK